MSMNEITAKVRELMELRRMAEELQQEIEILQDSIKAEMAARSVEELVAGPFKVRWTIVTASRFDSKALKAANPSLYETFVKTSETRRFVVA